MVRKVLEFVRDQLAAAARNGGRSDYARGFTDANEAVEEYILELMWERGDEG